MERIVNILVMTFNECEVLDEVSKPLNISVMALNARNEGILVMALNVGNACL